jgi:hypothetical protein
MILGKVVSSHDMSIENVTGTLFWINTLKIPFVGYVENVNSFTKIRKGNHHQEATGRFARYN